MKKIIALIALLGAASAFADTFGTDSYLYWMIDSGYNNWEVAKAHVVGTDTYLNIGYEGVVPTGAEFSSSGYDRDFNLWASLADVDTTKSIVIELYNDDVCFAESEALSLSSAAQYIALNRMSLVDSAWTATGFHIPEPNSAMLMLVGAALLGLKRKRVKKA